MNDEQEPKSDRSADDPGWYIQALAEDRQILTAKILRYLIDLQGQGYSPETIARVLGPIFGLYVRDHLAGNRVESRRKEILDALGPGWDPDHIAGTARWLRNSGQ
jgi:hypothetical protein